MSDKSCHDCTLGLTKTEPYKIKSHQAEPHPRRASLSLPLSDFHPCSISKDQLQMRPVKAGEIHPIPPYVHNQNLKWFSKKKKTLA